MQHSGDGEYMSPRNAVWQYLTRPNIPLYFTMTSWRWSLAILATEAMIVFSSVPSEYNEAGAARYKWVLWNTIIITERILHWSETLTQNSILMLVSGTTTASSPPVNQVFYNSSVSFLRSSRYILSRIHTSATPKDVLWIRRYLSRLAVREWCIVVQKKHQ